MMGDSRDADWPEGLHSRGSAGSVGARGSVAMRKIMRFICAFNGACAIVCGAMMMAGAVGLLPEGADPFASLVEAVRMLPLPGFMTRDLFWPGLALLLVNGVANGIATVQFARAGRTPAARTGQSAERSARGWALAAGVLLIGWCAFELAFMPNALSMAYLVVGCVQAACAALLVRGCSRQAA